MNRAGQQSPGGQPPGQGYQQQQQQPQQPQQQGPGPNQPMDDIKGTLGMIILVGIIILLVGAMLTSVSGYIETEDSDDWDNIRILRATGSLLMSLGVFIPGIGASYLLYSKYGLSDQEKLMLVIVASASILAFAMLSPLASMIN